MEPYHWALAIIAAVGAAIAGAGLNHTITNGRVKRARKEGEQAETVRTLKADSAANKEEHAVFNTKLDQMPDRIVTRIKEAG